MMDSTILRGHQYAASAVKNTETSMEEQRVGDKKEDIAVLHTACDALGTPIRFFITAGQRADDIKALDLIEGQEMSA